MAGYSIGLDISIRGTEDRSFRKSPDSYSVLGPWLVTADEIPNPGALDLQITVNGERAAAVEHPPLHARRCRADRDGVVDVHASPRRLIFTGTPEGVSPIRAGRQHRGHDREHRHRWRLPCVPTALLRAGRGRAIRRRLRTDMDGASTTFFTKPTLTERARSSTASASRSAPRRSGRCWAPSSRPSRGRKALPVFWHYDDLRPLLHGSGTSADREGGRAARAHPREPWTSRQVSRRPAASTSVFS